MNDHPQDDNIRREKSLSDRILRYAFLGSAVLNMGWIFWVAHSDIFGSGSFVDTLHPQTIKVVKPITIKHKRQISEPFKTPPPPPPPPKQQPKIKPLKPIVHPPKPQPRPRPTPQPRPQPHTAPPRRVAFAETKNPNAMSPLTMPSVQPGETGKPEDSGTDTRPPDKTPVGPPTPATPVVEQPKPVVEQPKPVVEQPKPVVHPPDWVKVDEQDAAPMGDFPAPEIPSDVDSGDLAGKTVVISYTIVADDSNPLKGHAINVRATKSCGNRTVDNTCVDIVKHMKFKPAIQDHLPQEAQMEQPFSF